MIISELIEELQKYPPNTEVVTDRTRDIENGWLKVNYIIYSAAMNLICIHHINPNSWYDKDIYYSPKNIAEVNE